MDHVWWPAEHDPEACKCPTQFETTLLRGDVENLDVLGDVMAGSSIFFFFFFLFHPPPTAKIAVKH